VWRSLKGVVAKAMGESVGATRVALCMGGPPCWSCGLRGGMALTRGAWAKDAHVRHAAGK